MMETVVKDSAHSSPHLSKMPELISPYELAYPLIKQEPAEFLNLPNSPNAFIPCPDYIPSHSSSPSRPMPELLTPFGHPALLSPHHSPFLPDDHLHAFDDPGLGHPPFETEMVEMVYEHEVSVDDVLNDSSIECHARGLLHPVFQYFPVMGHSHSGPPVIVQEPFREAHPSSSLEDTFHSRSPIWSQEIPYEYELVEEGIVDSEAIFADHQPMLDHHTLFYDALPDLTPMSQATGTPHSGAPQPFAPMSLTPLPCQKGPDSDFGFEAPDTPTTPGSITKQLANGRVIDRVSHNALERERRGHMRSKFDMLKAQIPVLKNQKASSLQVLREAVRYIRVLQEEEADLIKKKELLKQQSSLSPSVSFSTSIPSFPSSLPAQTSINLDPSPGQTLSAPCVPSTQTAPSQNCSSPITLSIRPQSHNGTTQPPQHPPPQQSIIRPPSNAAPQPQCTTKPAPPLPLPPRALPRPPIPPSTSDYQAGPRPPLKTSSLLPPSSLQPKPTAASMPAPLPVDPTLPLLIKFEAPVVE